MPISEAEVLGCLYSFFGSARAAVALDAGVVLAEHACPACFTDLHHLAPCAAGGAGAASVPGCICRLIRFISRIRFSALRPTA